MRFGAPALMPASLVPSRLSASPEQLFQMVMNFNYGSVVQQLVDRDFRLVELSSDLAIFLPHVLSKDSIGALRRLAQYEDVRYTVHLPLWSVDPATPLESIRKASTQATIEAIRSFEPLWPERYVYHATGALATDLYIKDLPDTARALIMRQFVEYARRSVEEILSETGIERQRLAIENITFPFDLTVDLAEELGVSVCFDTGHALAGLSGPLDFFAALERALPLLGEIHLHDSLAQGPDHIMQHGQDHRRLGLGDLDTGRLLDTLHAADWDGPIIIELPDAEEARLSLDLIEEIRPQYAGAVRTLV